MLSSLLLAMAPEAAALPMPAFLAGCWEEVRADQGWTEECWTSSRGGLMIGSGRDGKADSVRHWEWMRIERATDGTVSFYGSPKGAAPVSFKATASDDQGVTFINAGHDYPQRVTYKVTPTGLDAEISMADGSRPNRWSYRRPGSSTAK